MNNIEYCRIYASWTSICQLELCNSEKHWTIEGRDKKTSFKFCVQGLAYRNID